MAEYNTKPPLKYRDKLLSFKVALDRAFDASEAGPPGAWLEEKSFSCQCHTWPWTSREQCVLKSGTALHRGLANGVIASGGGKEKKKLLQEGHILLNPFYIFSVIHRETGFLFSSV